MPWKTLLVLPLAGLILALIMFVLVDRRVTRALNSRDLSRVSAVFSSPLRISSLNPPALAALKVYLAERHYRDAPQGLVNPGDYSLTDSRLTIYTREFPGPNRETFESRKLSFDLVSGEIKNLDDKNRRETHFYLEPKPIASLGAGEQRASRYKKLSEIPAHVKNAVLAVEDERFYKHFGIDPVAILRAVFTNLKAMALVQGGSTLTQQLAKNTIFTPEKTLGRKLLEFLAALSIEKHLSKDQILELYLNEIYLGQEGSFALHGVAEACSSFFGKKIEEITVAEAALLAGIIKAPSYNSPRRHPGRAAEKKEVALIKMKELGFISGDEYIKARAQKITIIQESKNKRGAPHFTAALESELNGYFNLASAIPSGIKIYTGINHEMQECADKVLPEMLVKLEKQHPRIVRKGARIEAALVAIEPHSGLIKAWTGGRDFTENQFNHVSQAVRQIGSTIKPFLYLTALDGSLNSYKVATVTSILADEPIRVEDALKRNWEPENYDKTFRGDVTLRYALENSLNLPAVYVAQKVGIPALTATVSGFRLGDRITPVPALALGALDTTLLRLTAGYAALANGGIYVAPRMFITVLDHEDEIIARSPVEEEQIANESAVFVLNNILAGVLERGTGKVVRKMGYQRPAGGKTGTSNETRDAWFVGFTPNLATGVWVGFDDNSKIGLTGGTLAAPIWTEFMQCVQNFHDNIGFITPREVVYADIDRHSMQLAGPACPAEDVVKEVFVRGTEPHRLCRTHSPDPEGQLSDTGLNRETETRPRRKRSFWEDIFG